MWDKIIGGITGAANWMNENPGATTLIGSSIVAGAQYVADRDKRKQELKMKREQMQHEKDLRLLDDQIKAKYQEVPDLRGILAGESSPNLASGGILTHLKRQA